MGGRCRKLLVEFAQTGQQLGVGLSVGAELAFQLEALVRVELVD